MRDKIVVIILTFLFLLSLLISMYFILIKEMLLFVISFVICSLIFVISMGYISSKKTEIEDFEIKINNITKLYKSVLVKTNYYPNLVDKRIVRIYDFNELIDYQLESKRPIYYIRNKLSCSFILTEDDVSYIYIMKKNEDVISALEIIIKDIEDTKKQKIDMDKDVI